MAEYTIKPYIKLISIRVDMWESHIVLEKNTDDPNEIETFIEKHKDVHGVKIIMIEMTSGEMVTFDEVKKIIHNAHIFDYIRHLVSSGNKLLGTTDDLSTIGIGSFVKYILDVI